jgi:sodium pump decarboxylase gamma subunit
MDISNILAASLSLGEKVSISLTTLLTGFVVVFAVLILLIIIITIYGKIVYTAQNKVKKSKESKKSEQTDAVASAPKAVAPAPAKGSVSGISDEIVAVIAAAVDSTYGVGKAKITGIKKSKNTGGRSAWGQAGVMNNTRPF